MKRKSSTIIRTDSGGVKKVEDDDVEAMPSEAAAHSAAAAAREAMSAHAHELTRRANDSGDHEAARDAHMEIAAAHHAEVTR